MKLSSESSREPEIAPRIVDGEIYVRLAKPPSKLRVVLMLGALALSVGGGIMAAVVELNSVPAGSGAFAQASTECPGMTPEQKQAAALAGNH